jgi:7-carboxy-7-deazaguanine synthase
MDSLQVTEIFHSIQGESSWMGLPCVFVRLTGCPLRCRWCDTEYAFHGGKRMTLPEILERVGEFRCRLVEVTGGEPLAQKAAPELLRRLADSGHTVLLETSGALPIDALDGRVHRIVDLKCPDSGESGRNRLSNISCLGRGDEVKFVIASRRDYEWARSMIGEHRLLERSGVLLSPVHGELTPRDLAAWMLADQLPARLQVQLHKIVWSPDARGV